MTLAEAAAEADSLAQAGDERALATLRSQWDEEIEAAARDADYRVRAQAYRAAHHGAAHHGAGQLAGLTAGYRAAFLACAVLAAIGLVTAFLLPGRPRATAS